MSHICAEPGCWTIVPRGRCVEHEKRRYATSTKNRTGDPFYKKQRWVRFRNAFLAEFPLCEPHLLRDSVVAARVVDHVLPHRGDRELQWNTNNLQPCCFRCHNHKTGVERELTFTAGPNVIVCGLPAAGKTTYAQSLGIPHFDADALGLVGVEDIRRARGRWITQQTGPFAVIVASTMTAMLLAAEHRATVHHCIIDERLRHERLSVRKNKKMGAVLTP